MKIKLLDYEAEVERISPQVAYPPWRREDTISVWFTFKEAVGSTLSFAIEIEPKDYTEKEFINLITVKGESALGDIIRDDAEARELSLKRESKRKQLNKLTADLGDKLGVPYHLDIK